MKNIRSYILSKQEEFGKIGFFQKLDHTQSLSEILNKLNKLTFFVLTFQDILRLNEERISDDNFKRIARHHRLEDRGHENWFLHDIHKLDTVIPHAANLFGEDHRITRDVSYKIVHEMYSANTDYASIAVILVLEATGHMFFTSIASNLERLNIKEDLWYFSRKHLDVELNHEVFENKINEYIDSVEVTDVEGAKIMAMVDRIYDYMAIMLNNVL